MKTLIVKDRWVKISEQDCKIQCLKGFICIYIGKEPDKESEGFKLTKREFFNYKHTRDEALWVKTRDPFNSSKLTIYKYKRKGFLW